MLQNVKEFTYKKLSPEEMKSRHILGRLVGDLADFKNKTRNERLYSEEVWDKTFNDPLVKEKLENRLMLGELGHPADRQEIDIEKVAICLAEEPKKLPNGKIQGVFDILDTPNGRILNTLCEYGCKIGVSSRGSGDVNEDFDGGEEVVPGTYDLQCWDAVLIPAVKSARPSYITESLNGKSLKKSLTESLANASEEDRKIMKETLNQLDIDTDDESVEDIEETKEEEVNHDSDIAANDAGANMMKDLQESLQHNKELESKILELQEKLSVCYAKEAEYEAQLGKYKTTTISLSESVKHSKSLKTENDSLNEQLNNSKSELERNKLLIESANKRTKIAVEKNKSLTESISILNSKLDESRKTINDLRESLKTSEKKAEKTINELRENLEEVKQNSAIKSKEYSQKLAKSNELVEHYKKIAKSAVDRYIESKARMIGVNSVEIKNKLNENYSFADIDRICEDLKSYKVSVSKLPFSVNNNRKVGVKVTESKEPITRSQNGWYDDEVDEDLLRMAQLNNP